MGILLHLAVATGMARWASWREEEIESRFGNGILPTAARVVGIGVASLILALAPALYRSKPSLVGKRIVLFEKGYLNWLKPKHGEYGRLSIGMYGLLPDFIRSLGAECRLSAELSEEELSHADALVLIYPNEPWQDGQLERIRRFVEKGGTFCVFGEHTVREKDGGARFNDVLQHTGIRVQFDSAYFAVGGWLHSYEALAHPITLGIRDERNQFGLVIGASLDVQWPARPIIVGRWGWSDWGDEGGNAMMGNKAYDSGERLGDLVLVAEQRLGAGRVVVFGDTSGISNGINIGSHGFNSRLFAYLTSNGLRSSRVWRDLLCVLGAITLLGLLALRLNEIEY
ncbi:MAG: hypothetical protein ACUVWX_11335, partial [Kiritimatiellia bacterium]